MNYNAAKICRIFENNSMRDYLSKANKSIFNGSEDFRGTKSKVDCPKSYKILEYRRISQMTYQPKRIDSLHMTSSK